MKYLACFLSVLISSLFCCSHVIAQSRSVQSNRQQQQQPPPQQQFYEMRNQHRMEVQQRKSLEVQQEQLKVLQEQLEQQRQVQGQQRHKHPAVGAPEEPEKYTVKSYDGTGRLEGKVVVDGNTRKIYDGTGRLLEKTVVEGAPSNAADKPRYRHYKHDGGAVPAPVHPAVPGQYSDQHEAKQGHYTHPPHPSMQDQPVFDRGRQYDSVGGKVKARPRESVENNRQSDGQGNSGQYQSRPDFTARQMENSRIRVKHLPDGSVLITNE
ncbi:MAG: hypothetical protein A4E69_03363 [Syntrophus sp. PtaB.Bin138]|nr:MAG: hypothetical protein A4E69_03363 [Syntrophus sp. PtaB.Bin138]